MRGSGRQGWRVGLALGAWHGEGGLNGCVERGLVAPAYDEVEVGQKRSPEGNQVTSLVERGAIGAGVVEATGRDEWTVEGVARMEERSTMGAKSRPRARGLKRHECSVRAGALGFRSLPHTGRPISRGSILPVQVIELGKGRGIDVSRMAWRGRRRSMQEGRPDPEGWSMQEGRPDPEGCCTVALTDPTPCGRKRPSTLRKRAIRERHLRWTIGLRGSDPEPPR